MTLEWRHLFPNLGRNKGLREMLSRAQLWRWNQMVFKRRLRMNDSIKQLSRIFKFLKTLIFFKEVIKKKILFSIFPNKIFEFSKYCNIYDRTLLDVYVRIFKLGKWRTYGILKIKMAIFHAFSWDFRIFMFLNFIRFWRFKKCFRVIFRILDEKLT